MLQPSLSKSQVSELAALSRQLLRSIAAQKKRDRETAASLTRLLLYPQSDDAERLVTLIRSIVSSEKD